MGARGGPRAIKYYHVTEAKGNKVSRKKDFLTEHFYKLVVNSHCEDLRNRSVMKKASHSKLLYLDVKP